MCDYIAPLYLPRAVLWHGVLYPAINLSIVLLYHVSPSVAVNDFDLLPKVIGIHTGYEDNQGMGTKHRT